MIRQKILWVFCSGILLNLYMAYLTIRQTPKGLVGYGRIIFLSVIVDIFFLFVAFGCDASIQINDGLILMLPSYDIFYSYKPYSWVVSGIRSASVVQSICAVPTQYFYRWWLIVRNKEPQLWSVLTVYGMLWMATGFTAVIHYHLFSGNNAWNYTRFVPNEWLKPKSLDLICVGDTRTGNLLFIWITTIEVLIAYLAVAVFTSLILRHVPQQDNDSPRTRRMKAQFTRMLTIQAVMPLIFTVLPYGLMGVALIGRFRLSLHICTFLMDVTSALSVLNPICCICFVTPYRNFTLRILRFGFCKKSAVEPHDSVEITLN